LTTRGPRETADRDGLITRMLRAVVMQAANKRRKFLFRRSPVEPHPAPPPPQSSKRTLSRLSTRLGARALSRTQSVNSFTMSTRLRRVLRRSEDPDILDILDDDSSHPRHTSRWVRVRAALQHQLSEPLSASNIFILLLIALATMVLILETMPELRPPHGPEQWVWEVIEAICVFCFTIELLVKFAVAPAALRVLIHPMNLVDIVAIAPFYVLIIVDANLEPSCRTGFLSVFDHSAKRGVACSDDGNSIQTLTILRAFRLIRVVRILKFGNFSTGVKVFTVAILKSTPQLIALLFFMIISMLVFSAILFYIETGCDDSDAAEALSRAQCASQKALFFSIPATFWWCMVTMTTVGYGDMVPITTGGRIVGCLTMLIGILVFSLPITVIGSNYADAYHKELMKRLIHELAVALKQRLRVKALISLDDVHQICKRWSSSWGAEHALLIERLEKMWPLYDDQLGGEQDGKLSRNEIVKLLLDLKRQQEEVTVSTVELENIVPDAQPLVCLSANGEITENPYCSMRSRRASGPRATGGSCPSLPRLKADGSKLSEGARSVCGSSLHTCTIDEEPSQEGEDGHTVPDRIHSMPNDGVECAELFQSQASQSTSSAYDSTSQAEPKGRADSIENSDLHAVESKLMELDANLKFQKCATSNRDACCIDSI